MIDIFTINMNSVSVYNIVYDNKMVWINMKKGYMAGYDSSKRKQIGREKGRKHHAKQR
jgi:hypothetical protein